MHHIHADYSSFFFNPFRNKWVFSLKEWGVGKVPGRCRFYYETEDAQCDGQFKWEPVFWMGGDRRDQPEPVEDYPVAEGDDVQMYFANAVAYESLLVGTFGMHRGPENRVCRKAKTPKLVDIEVGFSRDGFHFDRPQRNQDAFIRGERNEGAWDRSYLHSPNGIFVVSKDKLIFPYTAFSGVGYASKKKGMYLGGAVGIATLRRDGFASMNAAEERGILTTRPLTFSGKHLFVNVDAPDGSLRAEVLDTAGRPIEPFTLENCTPLKVDSTLHQISWKGGSDLSELKNRPVRLRFELSNGALYSFWISRDASGRSDGYLGAGGLDYNGVKDTIGKAALRR
jgi:hypothetical protein